jgi:hypothetical protein
MPAAVEILHNHLGKEALKTKKPLGINCRGRLDTNKKRIWNQIGKIRLKRCHKPLGWMTWRMGGGLIEKSVLGLILLFLVRKKICTTI